MRGRNREKVEGGVVGDKVKLMVAAPVGSLEFRVTRAPTVTWIIHCAALITYSTSIFPHYYTSQESIPNPLGLFNLINAFT